MKAQLLNTLSRTLHPCPYCGGAGRLAPMRGTGNWWRVRCEWHHCGGTTWAMDEPDKAVDAWNRRPADGEN